MVRFFPAGILPASWKCVHFSFISPGPSNLRVPSGKSKKRTISRSPMKRRFEIASRPPASQQHRFVEDLNFSAALDRQQSC